jgi:hypothetical protein
VRLTFVFGFGIICGLTACAGPPAPTPVSATATAPPVSVADCGPTNARPSGPELARAVLAQFTAENFSPYRNARAVTLSDDGTFARVMLCVDLRPTTSVDWEAYVREYDLANLGGVWRVQSSGSLTTVRARATDEAAQALAAGIAVDVARIEVVEVKQLLSYRSVRVTLRWRSADARPHTLRSELSFEAVGHGCRETGFGAPKDAGPIDARVRIEPRTPIGPDGEPDLKATPNEQSVPGERTYSANVLPFEGVALQCTSFTDATNVQLRITALDGVLVRQR